VIDSNWHPISYRFGVIAAYCSNFGHCVFEPPFGARVRDNVRCLSWAHWKARSGFTISVNWTFFLGVTAQTLGAKRDRKSAISLQRGTVDPKFQVEAVAPPTILFLRKLG